MTESEAVPVRDAATVVLLRDGDTGLETWLLTRHAGMAFAAGMSVFPGGRVDAGDGAVPVAGEVTDVAVRFDCPQPLAHALVAAAARETFEETGVLLTEPAADLPDARAAVEAGRAQFGALLTEHGLAVSASALRPWDRWVTPEGEVRRYDTRFFVAALPPGARATDVTTESSEAAWVPVAVALDQAANGERGLLPPTMLTLVGVGRHPTVADVLAAAADRRVEATRPVLRRGPDGVPSVELPDGTLLPVPRNLLR